MARLTQGAAGASPRRSTLPTADATARMQRAVLDRALPPPQNPPSPSVSSDEDVVMNDARSEEGLPARAQPENQVVLRGHVEEDPYAHFSTLSPPAHGQSEALNPVPPSANTHPHTPSPLHAPPTPQPTHSEAVSLPALLEVHHPQALHHLTRMESHRADAHL